MKSWWKAACGLLAVTAACALPVSASANTYPTQTLRILVPFGPGGGTDTVARALASRLAPVLGQSVVVENMPGGNSVIASRQVATAAPDGHTLLLTTDIHAINAAHGVDLPYDSLKGFRFVSQLTASPLMLMAHPSAGIGSVRELAEAARQRPNHFKFGSLGTSSPHFLAFEWWKSMAKVQIVDVPYKGGGQVLADNLGGHVDLSLIVAGNGIRHHQDGKLRALAVTGPARWPTAPEIPTFAEAGYPELVFLNWYAILAPAGTPTPVVERLNAEIRKIMHQPDVAEILLKTGLQPATGTSAELEAMVRRDIDKYRRIIELSGAKPEGR